MSTYLSLAICLFLFFAGHCVRDGWPSYKVLLAGLLGSKLECLYHLSTQWARLSGAILCGLGAYALTDGISALLIGAGILLGFYTDMKHGEAAGVDTPIAVLDAFLSGVTSLLPLSFVLCYLINSVWLALALLLVGVLKPGIWWLAWQTLRGAQDTWSADGTESAPSTRPCYRRLLGRLWAWFVPTRIAAGTFGMAIAAGLFAILGHL